MIFGNFDKRKIGAVGAGTVVFGLFFGYVIFPPILRAILKTQVYLKPGAKMRLMFEELPFPLDFKIYMFNTTNPDEVSKGAKPKLQEIGPYHFHEYKKKVDTVDDDVEDTLEFTLQNKFIFQPELSNGLTGNEYIILPDMLLTGALLGVKRDREGMLPLVMKGLMEIFKPKDMFYRGTVMDLLFNGYLVDCSSSEFQSKAVCTAFETEAKGLQLVNETHHKFSVFGATNDTNLGRFKVRRGIKNIKKLGEMVSYNDEPEQDIWDGDACNEYRGTDSTIFAPFMKVEDGLWAFTPDVCRSMAAWYERKSSYDGVPTLRYKFYMGDMRDNEDELCFCRDPPDDCPIRGTMDLFPCLNAPLIASMPHFWEADPSLLQAVDGLHPNKEDHEVYIDFEIISGTPMSAAKRLQFNLALEPVDGMDGAMEKVPTVVYPLFWVEEGAQLNKTFVNMLKYQLFLGLKFNAFVKWSCITLGTIACMFAGYLEFNKTTSLTLKVASAPNAVKDENGETTNPDAEPVTHPSSPEVYKNNLPRQLSTLSAVVDKEKV